MKSSTQPASGFPGDADDEMLSDFWDEVAQFVGDDDYEHALRCLSCGARSGEKHETGCLHNYVVD